MIVKHNNPCGVAIGEDALEAYRKALACDPMSAFGGVIAFNRPIGVELAEALHENFVEVADRARLRGRRARRSCSRRRRSGSSATRSGASADPGERDVKRVRGGLLIQDRDGDPEPREMMEVVTEDAAERAAVATTCSSPGPSSATCARTRS